MIGVLGGIASGKSCAAKALAGPSGVVLDADRMAREVLESEAVRAWLKQRFGASVILPSGAVDRPRLAQAVFSDPSALTELESRIHPIVRAQIVARLAAERANGTPRIVLDVPLLAEHAAQTGFLAECQLIVFVEAPAQLRQARAREHRNWTQGELAAREAQQLAVEAKRALAHYVIPNTGDLAALEHAVQDVLQRAGLEGPRSRASAAAPPIDPNLPGNTVP